MYFTGLTKVQSVKDPKGILEFLFPLVSECLVP